MIQLRKKLYDFIYEELIDLGCPVRILNGMPDHVHILFLQNPQKTITDIVKQIKGSLLILSIEKNLSLRNLPGKQVLRLIQLVSLS